MASTLTVLWLASLPALTSASPFGTINDALGQHNEHEMITYAAFRCLEEESDGICFEKESLKNLAGWHFQDKVGRGGNGAVGSPDTLDPIPEGPEAHCDNADFVDIPDYPQKRWQADGRLQTCVNHLRVRFSQGVETAARLLDDKNRIRKEMVEILDPKVGTCTFAFPWMQINVAGRAKCNALEGLGRALHGVQDFYSHSNWADHSRPEERISDVNPPGLGIAANAKFFDLRAQNNISSQIPYNLTTGCFAGLGVDTTPGSDGWWQLGPDCRNRVTHNTLNKDHGIISEDGSTSSPGTDTPRSQIGNNFDLAVQGAIRDSRRQWELLRREIRSRYGQERGNLMICALVRDNPAQDCCGRKIAIVIDSSGSNTWTDPSNLRIEAAKSFNSHLRTVDNDGDECPDNVTVIDFDDSARVIYPLGDPASASFDGIDSSGGTDIGSGIALAITELTNSKTARTANRSGIVVFTDGEDQNPTNQDAQLQRAAKLGIRVNFGFLSKPVNPVPKKRGLAKREPSENLLLSILYTGGIFGNINSAEAQKNFVALVTAHGATGVDGSSESIILVPGVTIADYISTSKSQCAFTYTAMAGESLEFAIAAKNPRNQFVATLHDIRNNVDVGTVTTNSSTPSVIHFNASSQAELELIVTAAGNASTTGVFTCGFNTSMPDRNTTLIEHPTLPIFNNTLHNTTSPKPLHPNQTVSASSFSSSSIQSPSTDLVSIIYGNPTSHATAPAYPDLAVSSSDTSNMIGGGNYASSTSAATTT
jgi:Mg-chelatase subunit ChlD